MKQLAAIAVLGLCCATAQAQCFNTPLTVALLAHGSTPVGSVTVSNDATNLDVTFTAAAGWTIGRLDLAVATSLAGIPQSNGQPNLSQFPNHKTFSPEVSTYTFTIPLGANVPGTSLVVAAHAAVDSPTHGHQQAWGAGQLFPCSPACTQGGGCDDHGDHAGGASASHDGGGDDCHGDHGDGLLGPGQLSATQRNARLLSSGGQCGCGDHGDDHSHDHGYSGLLLGGSTDGGNDSCGGDDHGNHHSSSLQGGDGGGDHGGDGGGDHGGDGGGDDDGGSDCQAGCGATFFTYVVNCINIE